MLALLLLLQSELLTLMLLLQSVLLTLLLLLQSVLLTLLLLLQSVMLLLQMLLPLNQLAQFHHLHAPQDIIQTLMEIVSQMSVFQKSSIMEKNFAKLVILQMDKVDV
jgi:hypothetical protein